MARKGNYIEPSTKGYKANSPDRGNPYNVIPSGQITMKGVPHPVIGIDEFGNQQYMMPGGEYNFPGNQVFELPIRQGGGPAPVFVSDPNDHRYKAYSDSIQFRHNYPRALHSVNANPEKFGSHAAYLDALWNNPKYPLPDTLGRVAKKNPYAPENLKFTIPPGVWSDYPGGTNMYDTGRNIPKPKQPVYLEGSDEANIIKKQQELKEVGLYKGKIDGIWGDKSQKAWDEHQKDKAVVEEQTTKPIIEEPIIEESVKKESVKKEPKEPKEKILSHDEWRTKNELPIRQGGGHTPIVVDNPADPRLHAYQDSLNLFKGFKKAEKLFPEETDWSIPTERVYAGNSYYDPNFKSPDTKYWNSFDEYAANDQKIDAILEEYRDKDGYITDWDAVSADPRMIDLGWDIGMTGFKNKEDLGKYDANSGKLAAYYETLDFHSPTSVGYWGSPDLGNPVIKPTREWVGTGWNPKYRKPVQPYQYSGDPKDVSQYRSPAAISGSTKWKGKPFPGEGTTIYLDKPKRTTPDPDRSVSDNLKAMGQDSSFANREKLAEQAGIPGYKGTAEQNVQLNKWLHEGGLDQPTEDKTLTSQQEQPKYEFSGPLKKMEEVSEGEFVLDKPKEPKIVKEPKEPVEVINQKPGAWYKNEEGKWAQASMQSGGTTGIPNFVKRMQDPNAPIVHNKDGSVSSHLMTYGESDGKYYAYPTLVQQGDSLMTPNDPWQYAMDNNNYLQFDTEAEAKKFAAGSWKKKYGGNMAYTDFNRFMRQGGAPIQRGSQIGLEDYRCGGKHMQEGGVPEGFHMMPDGRLMQNEAMVDQFATGVQNYFTKQAKLREKALGGKTATMNQDVDDILGNRKNAFTQYIQGQVGLNIASETDQEVQDALIEGFAGVMQMGGNTNANQFAAFAANQTDWRNDRNQASGELLGALTSLGLNANPYIRTKIKNQDTGYKLEYDRPWEDGFDFARHGGSMNSGYLPQHQTDGQPNKWKLSEEDLLINYPPEQYPRDKDGNISMDSRTSWTDKENSEIFGVPPSNPDDFSEHYLNEDGTPWSWSEKDEIDFTREDFTNNELANLYKNKTGTLANTTPKKTTSNIDKDRFAGRSFKVEPEDDKPLPDPNESSVVNPKGSYDPAATNTLTMHPNTTTTTSGNRGNYENTNIGTGDVNYNIPNQGLAMLPGNSGFGNLLYNPYNTYLDTLDERGRLFGKGLRRRKSTFSHGPWGGINPNTGLPINPNETVDQNGQPIQDPTAYVPPTEEEISQGRDAYIEQQMEGMSPQLYSRKVHGDISPEQETEYTRLHNELTQEYDSDIARKEQDRLDEIERKENSRFSRAQSPITPFEKPGFGTRIENFMQERQAERERQGKGRGPRQERRVGRQNDRRTTNIQQANDKNRRRSDKKGVTRPEFGTQNIPQTMEQMDEWRKQQSQLPMQEGGPTVGDHLAYTMSYGLRGYPERPSKGPWIPSETEKANYFTAGSQKHGQGMDLETLTWNDWIQQNPPGSPLNPTGNVTPEIFAQKAGFLDSPTGRGGLPNGYMMDEWGNIRGPGPGADKQYGGVSQEGPTQAQKAAFLQNEAQKYPNSGEGYDAATLAWNAWIQQNPVGSPGNPAPGITAGQFAQQVGFGNYYNKKVGGALYPLGGAIPYGSMPYADMEYAKLMYALGGNIPQYIGGGSNNLVETNAYGNPYLDPNSKTDVDEKLKFQYNPEEVVGAGIAATNWGANLLNYDPGLSGQLSDMQTADALNPVISRESAREGTYDPFGNFIDDEKVVAQNKGYNMFGDRGSNLNQGRYGGTPNMQYKQGGEYDLSKPEIDAIIKAGGEVEYL